MALYGSVCYSVSLLSADLHRSSNSGGSRVLPLKWMHGQQGGPRRASPEGFQSLAGWVSNWASQVTAVWILASATDRTLSPAGGLAHDGCGRTANDHDDL